MRVMVVSRQGEGSLILLLEHNNQRANALSGRRRLTKEKRERIREIFIDKGSHWLVETPRE